MTVRRSTAEVQGRAGVVRCAVYTRKSTDEGLEQDFNSLDAQRECAEAYIMSQRSEGWVALPDRYDDGGFSGGNMERPALQRLLGDIELGKVDCVAVYKVDRLSRSLLDFARIIEVFDQHGVSFVSVTQQFNTATSMGRLILNVLLSFAQFEREMIAERTRDKMHAARRKGKWIGGFPPLGYDVDPNGGRLVVNPSEAEQVREIFRLYLDYQSLGQVAQLLNARGWTSKSWTTRKGKRHDGHPWDKSRLFRLLTNAVYVGKVAFKGEMLGGEHEAIIPECDWQRARELLDHNGRNGGADVRNRYGALLKGLLRCAACDAPMTHAYTRKGNKLYRYYVCSKAQEKGWKACPTRSVSAGQIEQFVVARIRDIVKDPALVAQTLATLGEERADAIEALRQEASRIKGDLQRLQNEKRSLITAAANDEVTGKALAEKLKGLQERLACVERRQTEVNEQLIALERAAINEGSLRAALSLFAPVWEQLFPREQCRIMRLLIKRVDYDGSRGALDVIFRDSGIKALAEEAAGRG
ncbi:MAG TPA: recombinase family protein [Planctomycetota bacterium]|nr:recombinase family protein [Planctomycetota bacterium]